MLTAALYTGSLDIGRAAWRADQIRFKFEIYISAVTDCSAASGCFWTHFEIIERNSFGRVLLMNKSHQCKPQLLDEHVTLLDV